MGLSIWERGMTKWIASLRPECRVLYTAEAQSWHQKQGSRLQSRGPFFQFPSSSRGAFYFFAPQIFFFAEAKESMSTSTSQRWIEARLPVSIAFTFKAREKNKYNKKGSYIALRYVPVEETRWRSMEGFFIQSSPVISSSTRQSQRFSVCLICE